MIIQLVLTLIHYKDSSSQEFQSDKPIKHFIGFPRTAETCKEGKSMLNHSFIIRIDFDR